MRYSLPILVFCAAALPSLSFGQSFELWGGGGTSLLSNNQIGSLVATGQASDVVLKDGFRINFRMALNTGGHFGHELGYAYNRTQLSIAGSPDQGMAIHQGFYNYLAYFMKEGAHVRPFATGGVQFSNFVPPGSSATYGQGSTKFGVNYGAGIKVRVSSSIGIRFDVRQYQTPKPFDLPLSSGWLRQNEISAAIGFLL